MFYDAGGALARREEDSDADGRVDRWLTFDPETRWEALKTAIDGRSR